MCACGEPYMCASVNHCLTCNVTLRHNSLRDLLAVILEEICKDDCIRDLNFNLCPVAY